MTIAPGCVIAAGAVVNRDCDANGLYGGVPAWRNLGEGVTGHAFQSPFASPPGEGLSSSTINVLWGFFNLVIGYLLVCRVGTFSLRRTPHVVVFGMGILAMCVMAAKSFGRFHGGL